MPPRKGLNAAARRRTLIDTGWDLLVEGGVDDVTIDRVVQRLDITRPIFYRHFDDRIALLAALYDRYSDDLYDAVEPVLTAEYDSLSERMRASYAAYFDMAAEHGLHVRRLVTTAQDDPRMAECRERLGARFSGLWFAALLSHATPQQQALVTRDPSITEVLRVMINILQGAAASAASIWLTDPTQRPIVEDVLALIVAGLDDKLAAYAEGERPA